MDLLDIFMSDPHSYPNSDKLSTKHEKIKYWMSDSLLAHSAVPHHCRVFYFIPAWPLSHSENFLS